MPLPNFLKPHAKVSVTKSAVATRLVGAGPPSRKLGLSVTPQQQANWCWAAVSASVAGFYSAAPAWTQCTVANAALPRTDCCGGGASDPQKCNKPWYLDIALNVTGTLDRVEARTFTFAEVQTEIARAAPLGTRVGWSGGGGHFQTIVGWLVAGDGTQYVDVSDPIYLDMTIAYSQFVSAYQSSGTWTHSYVTMRPPPSTAHAMAGGAAYEVFDRDALGA